jgi:exodeoxyribonuclease V gamma subunit
VAVLHVHRSERADPLVAALGEVLAVPPADPIVADVVSVPTRGVERWLAQRLSHRLGVCANVDMPLPGVWVDGVTATACGLDAATDPWRPERLTWTLVGLIDEADPDGPLAPLLSHLDALTPTAMPGSMSGRRRVATAAHLAELFAGYALARPDLLVGWGAGRDPGGPAAWQATLWRQARRRLAVPSPAERLRTAASVLAADPSVVGLPARVGCFGLTRLAPGHLAVLEALAVHRDVHLYLLHPSDRLWDRVAAAGAPAPGTARRLDPTARTARHPLLASWGRDVRELQLLLTGRAATDAHHPVPDRPGPATLLGRIQDDIRADRRPPGDSATGDTTLPGDLRPLLGEADDSLAVHACHGRGRQAEVVHDAVLHLLADHPVLEARDVIVMCPDIEAFAPHIHAAFAGGSGGGTEVDGTVLRVRLADRALRQTNPLLSVAGALLDLAGSRVGASGVLDLTSRPPVARRFRFDRADLSTIERWVAGTAVRWGLDADHRAPWSLGTLPDGTWRAGLDRLLLGVTMGADDAAVWADTVPYDDIPSSEVDLAGRFVELVDRLGNALDSLSADQPVGAWVDALARGTLALAATPPDEAWQVDQLRRVLGEVAGEAGGGIDAAVSLDEVRSLLGQRLLGRPTRANFRTGDLTISTLMPMRSVPHRVVVLLGLDDGVYPRHPERDGDDLLLDEPCIGERDARSEDRQLLLDALLAATDHLIVTYAGRDERTNRPRPPSVPVAELLDVIDDTVRCADGAPARTRVVTEQPLQAFADSNFAPGRLGRGGPWSHDGVHLDGALARRRQRGRTPWLAGPLPPVMEEVVSLDALVSLLVHPTAAFLRRRLGLWLTGRAERVLDALPIELTELEQWGVGDRLLHDGLAGIPPSRAAAAARGRGRRAPRPHADAVFDKVGGRVQDLLEVMRRVTPAAGPGGSLDVHVELPGGRHVAGTVPGVHGSTMLACSYSTLAPKHRLPSWVRLLALGASRPELAVGAVTVGRGRSGQPVQASRLLAPGTDPATRRARCCELLGELVDLYDRGLRAPLPLPCATAADWADARRRGSDEEAAGQAARFRWDDGTFPGECSDVAAVEVWGCRAPLTALLATAPLPDEHGGTWPAERSRFGVLARRLWDPLLDHEQLGAAL